MNDSSKVQFLGGFFSTNKTPFDPNIAKECAEFNYFCTNGDGIASNRRDCLRLKRVCNSLGKKMDKMEGFFVDEIDLNDDSFSIYKIFWTIIVIIVLYLAWKEYKRMQI